MINVYWTDGKIEKMGREREMIDEGSQRSGAVRVLAGLPKLPKWRVGGLESAIDKTQSSSSTPCPRPFKHVKFLVIKGFDVATLLTTKSVVLALGVRSAYHFGYCSRSLSPPIC